MPLSPLSPSHDAVFIHGDSLGCCMRRIYRFHVESEGKISDRWRRDWPRSERTFRDALRRIGTPVWFLDRDPAFPGIPAHIVASLDPADGQVLFTPTPASRVPEYLPADNFDLNGALRRNG